MTPRTLAAASLLLLTSIPASAEFCTLNGHTGATVIRRLKSPACTMENALVFNKQANENRYGEDESVKTQLTDSWPGWGGGDKKCAAARKSADSIGYGDETYVMGRTMLGWQIWRYSGSCDTLKSQFLRKQASLKEKGDNPSLEAVFEAIGNPGYGHSIVHDAMVNSVAQLLRA